MWEFDALLREKGSWFALSCYSSFYIVILWSHVSYDWTTRPTRLLWPFSSDMPLYNTGTIAALLFLSFLSLLLMWDQSVFVHAGWQLSSMFTTPEGEASLSQNRWGGLVCPLSLSLSLSLCVSLLTPYFNILAGLELWNKLMGLPKVYAFVEVTLCFS